MASKAMMTGMRGVFLVAAELTKLDWIVAPTSRNAMGADLLITDKACTRTWSVQVKANSKPKTHWLVGKNTDMHVSDSHMYVFVDLKPNDERPEFYVIPSRTVARQTRAVKRPNSVWYRFDKDQKYRDAWIAFGQPETERK